MEILHAYELIFIQWIQQVRSPFLDQFILFLNFFDSPAFYLILIPAIWAGYYWKWGARILLILLVSALINALAKTFFAFPRPYELVPSVGMLEMKTNGFPSGAAQAAILLAGIFIKTNHPSF